MEPKLLYSAIDRILREDWDPIGAVPGDEYQGYVAPIFNLVMEGSGEEVIAQKLHEIETEGMGLNGNKTHCLYVASKILKAADNSGT